MMDIPQPQDRAYMGQFLREMQETQNLNTFIHGFYRPRYAFAPSAVVVQQKKFPDVSFYQGMINWDLMHGKTDAVIIRAGQNNWVDTQFVRNWAEARARGMLRGTYWFYDGRRSPTEQADLLVSLIKNDLPDMEIIFDWEKNYGGAYEGIKNVVLMMKRVEALLPGKAVAMYTGYYWFIQNSNPVTHAAEYAYLKTKGLHLAWYTNDASLVKVPAPWTSLYLWQFGTPPEGAAYGCAIPNIDMNYFNGTTDEFYARYGAEIPQPPTGETSMTIYDIKSSMNIRAGASIATADIGDLATGDRVEVKVVQVSATDKWGRIAKITRAGVSVALPAATCYVSLNTTGTVEYVPPVASIYISHTFTDTLVVDNPDGSTRTYSANFTVPDVEYKPNP